MKSEEIRIGRIVIFYWLASALGMQVAARADLAPRVKIRMPADREQAVAGQGYEGMFPVYLGQSGALADSRIEGERWTILAVEAPSAPGPG